MLNGQILDEATDEPLAGANIYPLNDWQRGTATDAQGYFTLETSENDTLMATFMGYREQVVVASQKELTVRLQAVDQNLEAVTVEAASLVAEEFSIKKIEQMEVYTNPNAKGDPLLAVNALPAATTLDESANISLRGSRPGQTGIFLNDVPIYDAVRFGQLNGIGTFSIFNTALIQQLQVFPSNPPLEFGNTSAGLISLQTIERVPEQASGSLALSPANLGAFATLPTGAESALTLFGNFQPSGMIRALNPESLADLKHFQTLDFGAHYVHKLGRSQLKVFNYSVSEGYRFTSRHPSGDGTFRQRKRRNFTVARYQTRYDHALVSINGGFSLSRMHFAVGNLDVQLDQRDLYLSANYARFWDTWTLKTGLTYDTRRAQYAGQWATYDYARGVDHPTSPLRSTLTNRVPEGYAYAKYQPNDRWTLGAGLRKNMPSASQQHYLSYQANVHRRIWSHQTLTASVGRYHQYVIPQEDTPSSFYRSHQLALDYQYQRKQRTLTTALFYKETKHGTQRNQVYGAEVSADIRWSSRLRTQASYTYLNATVHDGDRRFASPYDLSYFTRGSVTYKITSQWTLSVIAQYRQGTYYRPVTGSFWNDDLTVYAPQYAAPDQAERLPDYSTIDFSVARVWPLSGDISMVAFGSINNLLNRQNVRAIDYNEDYSVSSNELFSQRVLYFGVVLQWR